MFGDVPPEPELVLMEVQEDMVRDSFPPGRSHPILGKLEL